MDKPGEKEAYQLHEQGENRYADIEHAIVGDDWKNAYSLANEFQLWYQNLYLPSLRALAQKYGNVPIGHRFYPTEKVLHD